ncbi:MAG: hypothetical protein BWX48_01197 [Verrucomicrobia bacterium ADurb.Bin006]|nr:MAG: hypothetical protein BWX48_01197 [Verrucomicrobia bacterium ADurb.Bin006]
MEKCDRVEGAGASVWVNPPPLRLREQARSTRWGTMSERL